MMIDGPPRTDDIYPIDILLMKLTNYKILKLKFRTGD